MYLESIIAVRGGPPQMPCCVQLPSIITKRAKIKGTINTINVAFRFKKQSDVAITINPISFIVTFLPIFFLLRLKK